MCFSLQFFVAAIDSRCRFITSHRIENLKLNWFLWITVFFNPVELKLWPIETEEKNLFIKVVMDIWWGSSDELHSKETIIIATITVRLLGANSSFALFGAFFRRWICTVFFGIAIFCYYQATETSDKHRIWTWTWTFISYHCNKIGLIIEFDAYRNKNHTDRSEPNWLTKGEN